MNVREILELHGFEKDSVIKQIRIENGKRKYVIKDNDKYFLISETIKEEIEFTEKVQPKPIVKEEKTEKKSKKKSKKRISKKKKK